MPVNRRLTTEPEYHGLPINVGSNNDLPCDTKILGTIERVMKRSLEEHSRILVARFDLTFPQTCEPHGNKEFKEIMKQTVTSIQRHDNTKPEYVAVREQSEDGGYHYNGILILDNRVKKSPMKVLKEMERIEGNVLGLDDQTGTCNWGLVHSGSNIHIVHRGNDEEFAEAFHRASYLAKLKEKGDEGRELFCSKTK